MQAAVEKFTSTLCRALVLLCLSVVISAAPGATLKEYTQSISTLRNELQRVLLELREDNRDSAPAETDTRAIRRAIPPPYRIEFDGGVVETDLRWIEGALKGVEEASNREEKIAVLESIHDRILAIGHAIDDLEAAEASTTTKDETKRSLAEILSRAEYQKPSEGEESLFARWWRQIREWLESKLPQPEAVPMQPADMQAFASVLQVVLFAAVFALLAFLFYRFMPALRERLGLSPGDEAERRVVLGEQIDDNVSSADLLAEAERLAREGELRLAVRRGYMALLCELSDRRLVALARHKTNSDYIRDLRKRPGVRDAMTGATSRFEASWYGTKQVESADWEDFRSAYAATISETQRQ